VKRLRLIQQLPVKKYKNILTNGQDKTFSNEKAIGNTHTVTASQEVPAIRGKKLDKPSTIDKLIEMRLTSMYVAFRNQLK
jgi:hypothetical protein